jgi:DNA repair exonuclease SbcCD ATPase subunit
MLGQQLARLVASRRGRDSFQLIVISHDHLFINQLSEFATQYYEVRRNGKFSEIEAKDIERLSWVKLRYDFHVTI